MGLRRSNAGAWLSRGEFEHALANIRMTPTRLKLVEGFAAHPDGLTSAQLGRWLGNDTSIAHSTGNRAAGDFGKVIAKALRLPAKQDGWWVGAAFETWRDEVGSPLTLALWPKLEHVLSRADGWRDAIASGRQASGDAPAAGAMLVDDPGHSNARLSRDRQRQFRHAVLQQWSSQCAITGCAVESALEAAHLDRFSHHRTHAAGNGLPLRADLHRLLDSGYLRLRPEKGRAVVQMHPAIAEPEYRKLHGRRLAAPSDAAWRPDPQILLALYLAIGRRREGW